MKYLTEEKEEMKFTHDREIRAAFDEVFQPGEAAATQKKVDAACQVVFEAAAAIHGSEGLYVRALLNADMQGVSFRFKRPGISQRVEHFIPCKVAKPARKKDVDDNASAPDPGKDTLTGDEDNSGSPQDRGALLMMLASALTEDQYTKDGKPEVSAINEQLGDTEIEPFTAAERDELWGEEIKVD